MRSEAPISLRSETCPSVPRFRARTGLAPTPGHPRARPSTRAGRPRRAQRPLDRRAGAHEDDPRSALAGAGVRGEQRAGPARVHELEAPQVNRAQGVTLAVQATDVLLELGRRRDVELP